MEGLFAIHRAYVERVPYETLWIHLGDRWSIDAVESLVWIATQGRGGYCFHLNGALSELLPALGYDVVRREIVSRCKSLWEMRLVNASGAEEDRTAELSSFGWWFTVRALDQRWRMVNLLEVLRRPVVRLTSPPSVLEEVASLAEAMPGDAVEAVRLIVGAAGEGWEISAAREQIRSVLATGLRADSVTSATAIDLVHALGARGYADMRSVLDAPS